jgi:hypothetical protein
MRYLFAAAVLVATLLTVRWELSEPVDFEGAVARAGLAEQISQDDSRCPLSREAVERAETWMLAACAQGGLGWIEAARRYREDAAKVFLVYGQDPGFDEVFDRLGHPVVPVVAYFVRNGSTQYLLQETVGQGLSRLWNDGEIGIGMAELSPEQYGLIAIDELRGRGHEMLSEFEIVDGVAVRKQLTRTLLGAKNIVFGGVSDLEKVIARGERLPSWSEMGWATADALIVVGGVGAAAKVLRAAKAPAAVAGRSASRLAMLKTAGRGAIQSLSAVGTAAGVATVVALPYIAITHPELVTGAAGWLAEQAGMPAWLGVLAAYLAFCLAVAVLLRLVLAPAVWVVSTVARLTVWLGGARRAVAPRLQVR